MRIPAKRIGSAVAFGSVARVAGAAAQAAHDAPHWSYSGPTGPTRWAALENDFDTCGVGTGAERPRDQRRWLR